MLRVIRRSAPGLVVLALLGAACSSSSSPTARRGTHSTHGQSTTTAQPTTTTLPITTTTTAPASTTTTAPATTTTTSGPPALQVGASGPAVLALRQRLTALGYWNGTVTDTFDDATRQAVYAYQKVAGVAADGSVGPITAAALARGAVPSPQSHSGHVVEVDLERDLLMIVDNGHVSTVLNTSTGGGYLYPSGSGFARAVTPRGHFAVYRQIDGLRISTLGELWRPKYFHGGFAVHGDWYVPPRPVSHGCVRVSNEAIDWIWASGQMPLGTPVWLY